MESFYRTLKVELIYQKTYATRREAKSDIFEYIEILYNRERLHSYLGYFIPEEYEKLMLAKSILNKCPKERGKSRVIRQETEKQKVR